MAEENEEKTVFTDEMREQARLLFPMNNDELFDFVPEMYNFLPEEMRPRFFLRPMTIGEKEKFERAYNKVLYGSITPEYLAKARAINKKRNAELDKCKTDEAKKKIDSEYDEKILEIGSSNVSISINNSRDEESKMESIALDCLANWENFYDRTFSKMYEYKGNKNTGVAKALRGNLHVQLVKQMVKQVRDISGLSSMEIKGLGA